MKYGYVRVSTAQQHNDRQIDALLELGLDKSCIYIDYESGKDFTIKIPVDVLPENLPSEIIGK